MDETKLMDRLREVAEGLSALEGRVSRLEQRDAVVPPGDPSDPGPAEAARGDADETPVWSRAFARLALACFALVGALVLRVLSQQGFWPLATGALVGLGYAAVLMIGPLVLPNPRAKPLWSVLSYCAAALAPLIALEGVWRIGTLSLPWASGVVAIFGLGTVAVALVLGLRGLALFGLLASSLSMIGLGLELTGLLERAAGVVSLALAGLFASRRVGWDRLRPAGLLPALSFLAVSILATGRRAGVDPAVPLWLMGALLIVALAVAGSHLLARRAPVGQGEAVWLPLFAGLSGALATFCWPLAAGLLCAGLGGVGLFLLGRAAPPPVERVWPQASAPLLAAWLLTAAGLRSLDPTGAALALIAAAVLWPATRQGSNSLIVFGLLGFALASVDWLRSGSGLIPGASLAAGGLLGHLVCLARSDRGPEAAGYLAPVWLAFSLAAGFWWIREAAGLFFSGGPAVGLTLSLCMLGAGTVLLLLGRRQARKGWTWLGLLVLAALGGKVLLLDLFGAEGIYLLGSVAALGAGFVVASLSFRSSGDEPA